MLAERLQQGVVESTLGQTHRTPNGQRCALGRQRGRYSQLWRAGTATASRMPMRQIPAGLLSGCLGLSRALEAVQDHGAECPRLRPRTAEANRFSVAKY
jgi:hypothetical protein